MFPLEWKDPVTGDVSRGYREDGYLPEAVINFLALLGWNPGTEQEILSLQELVEQFDLAKCSKAGAKFDYVKGTWFNHEYILSKSDAELTPAFLDILRAEGINATEERARAVVGLMKSRVNFVKELWPLCRFFFVAPTDYDEKTRKKRWKEQSPAQMRELVGVLAALDDFSIEAQEAAVHAWIERQGYNGRRDERLAPHAGGRGQRPRHVRHQRLPGQAGDARQDGAGAGGIAIKHN